MPNDQLTNVRQGDKLRIPAATWNELLAVAQAERDREQSINDMLARALPAFGVLKVKNNSGSNAPRFGILGLETPIITPTANLDEFKQRLQMLGTTPTTAAHTGKFCILYEPLAPGAIGWAFVSGAAICQIDVTVDTHTNADVKDGDRTKLASAATGLASILWKESGTGTKWALVRLGAGGGSDEKVATSSGNTGKYLSQVLQNSGTYEAAEDLNVQFAEEGTAPNKTIRLYIAADAITGYVAANKQVLYHDVNTEPRWLDLGPC